MHGSVLASALVLCVMIAQPQSKAEGHASPIERFLALDDPNPAQYSARRHLEARNEQFGKSAQMDVITEADATGFRYRIVSEEGSEYIRNHVFRKTLDTEKAMWFDRAPDHDGLTPDNYVFGHATPQPDGCLSFVVKPRRKEMMLIDGAAFFAPDGDLVRIQGKLAKTPSFWTRQVHITRWYKRFAGIRMPVVLESVANVRIAGQSTFRMTYRYESVNGTVIGGSGPGQN